MCFQFWTERMATSLVSRKPNRSCQQYQSFERGIACLQVSAERQSCHLCSIALCKSTKSIHQKSWNSSDASYLRERESDTSLCALEVVSLDRSQSTSRLAKCRQRYTWKCLKGRGRSFLKLLSKVVRYEQVMYIALVREKVGIVRANWRILVILDLFKSAPGNFSNHGVS
jgi:hypothetical protein